MGSLILQFGLLALVGTCIFAWTAGGPGERAGSSAIAVAWIASLASAPLIPHDQHPIAFLIFDVALATALLVIAIRYASLWLGVAMMVQAFLLALHGEHLGEGGLPAYTFVVLSNTASAVQLLAIVAATIASILERGRKAEPARDLSPHPTPAH